MERMPLRRQENESLAGPGMAVSRGVPMIEGPVSRVTAVCAARRQTLVARKKSMAQDKKDLVKILKQELEFIEKGGYRTPQHAAWRPQPIFQDSPTCLNFGDVAELRPCEECALVEFVPSERLQEKFPCRHISLDEAGLTLDSLYRSGTEEETYAAVSKWLKRKIESLEGERPQVQTGEPCANSRAKAARSEN